MAEAVGPTLPQVQTSTWPGLNYEESWWHCLSARRGGGQLRDILG